MKQVTEKNTSAQYKAQRHLDTNALVYVVSMKNKEKCNIHAKDVCITLPVVALQEPHLVMVE